MCHHPREKFYIINKWGRLTDDSFIGFFLLSAAHKRAGGGHDCCHDEFSCRARVYSSALPWSLRQAAALISPVLLWILYLVPFFILPALFLPLFIGLSFIRALTKWNCQSIYHLDAVYNLWLTGYVWGCSSDALWWNCKAAAFHLGWGHGREKEVQRRPVSLVGKTVCRPGEILENTTQHDATTHQLIGGINIILTVILAPWLCAQPGSRWRSTDIASPCIAASFTFPRPKPNKPLRGQTVRKSTAGGRGR